MEFHKRALEIATNAHKGQKRWNGDEYITHPIRVSNAVSDEHGQITALLHDVVEDTSVTLEELAKEFPTVIIEAIDALTKRPGEEYFEAIKRAKANPIAKRVKMADLMDNMADLKPGNRLDKYRAAYKMLQD